MTVPEDIKAYLQKPDQFPVEYLWWLRRLIEDERSPRGKPEVIGGISNATTDNLGEFTILFPKVVALAHSAIVQNSDLARPGLIFSASAIGIQGITAFGWDTVTNTNLVFVPVTVIWMALVTV